MKSIITVIGKDTVGLLAKVSAVCFEHDANIIDVNQTVMQDLFCMMMLVTTEENSPRLDSLRHTLQELGEKENLQIHMMHEDIFHSMHHI